MTATTGFDPLHPRRSRGPHWSLAVTLLLLLSSPVAAQTGRITGRVVDAAGAPLQDVQVYIPGTGLGTLTRTNGQFLILNAPAGAQELRAERIGLTSATQRVTVVAGQAVEVSFTLTTQALGLDEIVVTGTAGAARRREIGNTITQVTIEDAPDRPTSVGNMLTAAAPGISINAASGELGNGQKIRLRGNHSITMDNDPIIYIDGVRMRSEPLPLVRGVDHPNHSSNRNASALDGINPNDIERVEIISGPAATTLYGTEASSGVIQIFTKRGTSSRPVWEVETQQGAAWSRKFGTDLVPYYRLDPWLRTAHNQEYFGSVRGGGRDLQYYVSGQRGDEEGIVPNENLEKWVLRGNFTFTPIQSLQLQWNSGYQNQWQQSISTSNAMGLGHNVFRGDANYLSDGSYEAVKVILDFDIQDRIERMTSGGTITHSPIADLTNRLTIGYDLTNFEQRQLRPYGFALLPEGALLNHTFQNRLLNFDYVGTYRFGIMESLRSSFSWGGQAVGDEDRTLREWGINFPGAQFPTISSAAATTAWEERQKVWNAGFFFQNVFDLSNRYFLTLGVRVDGNSAFGSGFGLQVYPKASGVWVVSDESFWNEAWGQVKLRGAYGQAGRAPGAFDATRTWQSAALHGQPAFVPANLGDPDLGPEVSAELEAGFDASWLDDRIRSTFTYYSQKTTGALLSVTQIPSNGFQRSQLRNVGETSNKGLEVSLNASIFQRATWGWDAGVNVSTNHSKMESLGGAPAFSVGSGGFIMEGEPIAVMRGRYVRNPDVIATPLSSCTLAAAVADPSLPCIELTHLYGPSAPTLISSVNTTVRLPAGITLSALGEYKGGHHIQVNVVSGMVTRGGAAPECFPYYTSLDQIGPPPLYIGGKGGVPTLKADTPALWRARCDPRLSNDGYFIQPADFFRLRTVSAALPLDFLLPDRVSSGELTLALNNSWTWLNDGWLTFDPELTRAEGLVDSSNNHVPAPITFRSSLRFTF
jgi:outer membrane receptor protein involved in Fe transport